MFTVQDSKTTLTEAEQIAWLQKEHAGVWFSAPDKEGYCVKIKVKDFTGGIRARSLGGAIANIEHLRQYRRDLETRHQSGSEK